MPRHAVYWAPEAAHPLWVAGCRWLGRDPSQEPGVDGTPPPARAEPWRYGFHATLKAPFTLAEGQSVDTLGAAIERIAAATAAFALPPLQVATLGRFVALRLARTPAPLQALADACVTQLDGLRAPMPAPERTRRATGLDAAQQALLDRWGYPHVLALWRFHLTLSDPIEDEAERVALTETAQRFFAPALAQPAVVRSISLFEEAAPGAPLRLVQRFALRG